MYEEEEADPVLFRPFGVHLGRIFSQGHASDEVLEAARVDGAGEPATCFRGAADAGPAWSPCSSAGPPRSGTPSSRP
ncbi:hypothetical protein GCM10027162_23570 [Streptomyces incanus]